jgi:hypothetical protein
MKEHICNAMNTLQRGFDCGYGQAVDEIFQAERAREKSYTKAHDPTPVWVMSNGEYCTCIAFCPFCGVEL